MKSPILFPIRFKILITLLVVVTTVVGSITFTMANLFHADKRTYIHDLTSLIALHTAKETQTILTGYRQRLQIFARMMYDTELSQKEKSDLLQELFRYFEEFVAVTLYDPETGVATIYDANQLKAANLSRETFEKYRSEHPLPLEKIKEGKIFIENSTLSGRLPTLTIALAQKISGSASSTIVSATIRLDTLLGLTGRSKIFETFLIDGQGTILAHSDLTQVTNHSLVNWLSDLDTLLDHQSTGITTKEFNHEGVDLIGGFSKVKFGNLLIGVQIPKSAAFLSARELINELFWVALAILMISTLLGLIWSYRFTRPIHRLSKAADRLSKGEFDITLVSNSRDEIGSLSDSFNHMATELKAREHALIDANKQLVQSEKMSAFGQLSAGIAHEVKNPLAGILGYAQLSLRKLDDDSPVQKNIQIIEKEAKRCTAIIENIMKFAHHEQAHFGPIDINKTVTDALDIVDHQLTINQIEIVRKLEQNLPTVTGSANQIQQVLINLFINAQQAMEGEAGKITIHTYNRNKWIEIWIKDNGPGIPKEIQNNLFEPFFTTKPAGKGTGLGLSVSYGIIKDHKGKILLNSESGRGTAFIIILPLSGDIPSDATLPFPEHKQTIQNNDSTEQERPEKSAT